MAADADSYGMAQQFRRSIGNQGQRFPNFFKALLKLLLPQIDNDGKAALPLINAPRINSGRK
ncbi:hypothetical protein D3C76_1800760 [compost metagenome]